MRLQMTLWHGERISVLTLNGRLDADARSLLETGLEAAQAQGAPTIAIDCKRVTSVEPEGADALRTAHSLACAQQTWLILLNVHAEVARQLALAGVDQVMDIYGSGLDIDGPPPLSIWTPARA